MKRLLSVLLVAGTMLAALSAQAAPVFMLQFGSFETRAEADEKLAALKTKHAGVLSRMEAGVREVTLQPENLTVYRTQAGPLATRADAQSVCSQLASNGDECYVVESAMMQPATPAATQVAQTAPAPTAPAAMVPTQAETVVPQPSASPVPAPTEPTLTPGRTQTIPTVANRDPQSVAAMNRVASTVPTPSTVADTSKENDAMQRQLAEAAERQRAMEANPNPSPFTASAVGVSPTVTAATLDADQANSGTKPPVKDRSLWDRLFGDEEDEKPVAPVRVASADDAVQAAPVESIEATPMPAPPAPVEVQAAAPAPVAMQAPEPEMPRTVAPADASTPLPATTLVAPQTQPVAMTAPSPVMAAAAPVQPQPQPVALTPVVSEAGPFPLPPPPAPLVGKSRPAPVVVASTVAAPMPVSAQPNMPAPVMAQPLPTGGVPFQPGLATNVQVEEAKRVPLTQSNVPPAGAFPPPAPQATAAAPTMPTALSPSATIGQKTLWAQIGNFADAQSALAFWDSYRRTHPDFPVVRVRVTTPMMAQQRGIAQVYLRVGPFAREGFIKNLCATVVDQGMQCASITDMGVASSMGGARGLLPQSRYNR